jgi:hypothetical protein
MVRRLSESPEARREEEESQAMTDEPNKEALEVHEEGGREMTFSQAVFLSLLYQEPEWYTGDYVSRSDAVLVLRVLAALAGILFVVYLWWLRGRRRSWARSEYMTDEPDKAWGREVEEGGRKMTAMQIYVIVVGAVLAIGLLLQYLYY